MNRFFDMTTYAEKFLADAVQKLAFSVTRKGGDFALLQNGHCIIHLQNIDNDYVRFEFASSLVPDKLWEFADYLDCVTNGKAWTLRPLPPDDLGPEGKFVFMLQKYNELMIGGYFDAPSSGDFSWIPDLIAREELFKSLSSKLFALRQGGHPEAKAINFKKLDGDPTWMDDVRRILAEQEAKE